ncbi:hypothetical protein JCM5353_008293, partial [Sporobolomyces roseus]
MFHRHTRHHSTTVSELHPFAPSPIPLPPLPQTPTSHFQTRPTTPYQSAPLSQPQDHESEQGMFSRRSRSLSRNGRSTPLLFPHARQPQPQPQSQSTLDLSSALHSQELLDEAFKPLPASSVYSSSPPISPNSTRTSLQYSSTPPSPTSSDDEPIPSSRSQALEDNSLFAPASTLSQRKQSKLSHSFHHAEEHSERHRMRKLKAEMDIAIGVSHLYKESKKETRKGRSSSFSAGGGEGKGIEEIKEVFERVKVGIEEEVGGGSSRDRLALSGDRKESISATSKGNAKKGTLGGLNGKEMLETGLAVDAVVGIAAGGYALWKKHERDKRNRLEGEFTKRPSSAPVISPTMGRNASISSLPPHLSIPRPSLPTPSTPAPIYLSHLTPSQHKTLQHASAALLLKHHHAHLACVESSKKNGGNGKTYHYDEIGLVVGAVVGGWKELGGLVEEGIRKVEGPRKNHLEAIETDGGVEGRTGLFGVDIKELTKHEGVESKHGIDPNARGFKIPEFLDHLITALKQSDLSISGILRKSASLQKLEQIIGALDHADGSNETILDLAKLDPITLASLFKRFLAQLPHPVFTHH